MLSTLPPNGLVAPMKPENRYCPAPSVALDIPINSSNLARSSDVMARRSLLDRVVLPACTASSRTRARTSVLLANWASSNPNAELALLWVSLNWAVMSWDCVTSSARAAATGSSLGDRMRRPLATCCCKCNRVAVCLLMLLTPASKVIPELIRMMCLPYLLHFGLTCPKQEFLQRFLKQ